MLFVFMSQPDFACNPFAMYRYILEHTDHETAWVIKKTERYLALRERGVRCALYNTLAANQLILEADYVILNSYTFYEIPKREGQIFANLWHGSGIKAHDYYNYDMNPNHARKLSDFFEMVDLMCVHSLDDRFRLSAMLHYDIRRSYVTGQPRLDCVVSSRGRDLLRKLFGNRLTPFRKLIFFAPSFRANRSSHSGTIFSDNVFRLSDYDDARLHRILTEHDAALVYKLHPIEQTAFAGRRYALNDRCLELTDEMLFDADLRYDEILNAFDLMISDYSSIVFDFLLLNRPVVYLLPDYEEYTSERGFVFKNIDDYMPGEKAFDFEGMLKAIADGFAEPAKYEKERRAVLRYRFDYTDDQSAKRCYDTIMNFRPPRAYVQNTDARKALQMPTAAEQLAGLLPNVDVIDSAREIPERFSASNLKSHPEKKYLYVTEEIPNELRRLTGAASNEIRDISYYYEIRDLEQVEILHVQGGVNYELFSAHAQDRREELAKPRIGFAGVIDNRIYFAMVQCICEVFAEYDVIFAGEIYGKYPEWLDGFENLHFIETPYERLPAMIATFDVAILPFFGRHQNSVPNEFYQYLACGKQVVASDMQLLPQSDAVYVSASIADCIKQIGEALQRKDDETYKKQAMALAKRHDWSQVLKTAAILP